MFRRLALNLSNNPTAAHEKRLQRLIMPELNTHDVVMPFGKHKGERLTRVPVSYIRWMLNQADLPENFTALAKAEYVRRGSLMPVVELTGHAIDNASLRVRKIWHQTAKDQDEGLYSWLQRMTLEAIENGEKLESGKILYQGMKFIIQQGEEFPILKTIMSK